MNSVPATQRNPLVYLDIAIDGEPAGRIVIKLRSDIVPKTAENFRALCTGEKGRGAYGKPLHFKGTKFHKAISQFMIQGGDIINNDGSGGESIYGPTFKDENFKLKHEQGVLSMANSGTPHTNGSQFCITTETCYHLDGTNVVFGRVLAGIGIVREIQRYGDSEHGRPTVDCVIQDCGEILTSSWDVCCRDGTADCLPEYPSDHQDHNISVAELISCIKDIKNVGNCFFGDGEYKSAVRKYQKCLRYLNHVFNDTENIKETETREHLQEIRTTYLLQCNLNLAACYMKLEDYRACVNFCTEVLELDPRNEKALYRRGQANYALKNYDDALMDLKQAEKISPNNRAVHKLLDEIICTQLPSLVKAAPKELPIVWSTLMDLLNDVALKVAKEAKGVGNIMNVFFQKTGPYSRVLSWDISDF
ncbi:unnamed protein product [Arctia plantaginis]|uniref:peptidylprolyl isomerase n=1 Tax=Arctia plantaginis TaxID=874455 RepID=A0A8S0YZ98_ARCPL|nr:unnamed protein product [Arctia plantaginis]